MRRNAFNFYLPAACAVLAVVLTDPMGKADQTPAALMLQPPAIALDNFIAPTAAVEPPSTPELLHDRPRAHVVTMEVTAYCPCKKCCGKNARGITASGKHISENDGQFVAADTSILPFGTRILIPGYANNRAVQVLDKGGAIKGRKLDLFFSSHRDALQWGRRKMEVLIFE